MSARSKQLRVYQCQQLLSAENSFTVTVLLQQTRDHSGCSLADLPGRLGRPRGPFVIKILVHSCPNCGHADHGLLSGPSALMVRMLPQQYQE